MIYIVLQYFTLHSLLRSPDTFYCTTIIIHVSLNLFLQTQKACYVDFVKAHNWTRHEKVFRKLDCPILLTYVSFLTSGYQDPKIQIQTAHIITPFKNCYIIAREWKSLLGSIFVSSRLKKKYDSIYTLHFSMPFSNTMHMTTFC